MDFDSKRMALLAGVGDPEVRHEIVREQAEQLNETIESRKSSDTKDPVRLAVRKAIQKMIAEGDLSAAQQRSLDDVKAAILKGGSATEDPETGEITVAFKNEDVVAEGDIEECGRCGDMHAPVAPPPTCPMSHDHPEHHDHLMLDQPPMLEEDEAEEDDLVSEGDDAVINERDDGSLTLEIGGKMYELKEILYEDEDVMEDEELEESEIPTDATNADVNDAGEVEYSKLVK